MAKLLKHRVFISGILSPLVALVFYSLDYATLTRFSTNLEKNWLFRLSLSTLAMTVPFLVSTALALKERRTLSLSGKIGLALATLSLGLAWKPVSDGILRSKQVPNMALRDVAAHVTSAKGNGLGLPSRAKRRNH